MNNPALESAIKTLATHVGRVLELKKWRELKPHPPASEALILQYERHLGRPLCPMYRAFFSMHDGYGGLAIHGDVLSIRDLMPGSKQYGYITEWIQDGIKIGEKELARAIAIAKYDEPNRYVYADPSQTTASGEWAIIEYSPEQSDVYPDLISWFSMEIETCRFLLEEISGDELNARAARYILRSF